MRVVNRGFKHRVPDNRKQSVESQCKTYVQGVLYVAAEENLVFAFIEEREIQIGRACCRNLKLTTHPGNPAHEAILRCNHDWSVHKCQCFN
jgi:sulfite reductase beta subunit-like hemoprotein